GGVAARGGRALAEPVSRWRPGRGGGTPRGRRLAAGQGQGGARRLRPGHRYPLAWPPAAMEPGGMSDEPVLRVRGLRKAFGGVVAVEDVDFGVAAGEIVALSGPNGAGKSTCFNMLMGQIAPDAGSVHMLGQPCTGMPPRRIWRLGVGRTFQVTATFG